jgi:hypothetical protein
MIGSRALTVENGYPPKIMIITSGGVRPVRPKTGEINFERLVNLNRILNDTLTSLNIILVKVNQSLRRLIELWQAKWTNASPVGKLSQGGANLESSVETTECVDECHVDMSTSIEKEV